MTLMQIEQEIDLIEKELEEMIQAMYQDWIFNQEELEGESLYW